MYFFTSVYRNTFSNYISDLRLMCRARGHGSCFDGNGGMLNFV